MCAHKDLANPQVAVASCFLLPFCETCQKCHESLDVHGQQTACMEKCMQGASKVSVASAWKFYESMMNLITWHSHVT